MNILFIEDNESIIDGVLYAFKKEGYNIEAKSTLNEASDYVDDNKIDLIILDVELPDGNGFEFYEDVLTSMNIPVIFLTALDDESNIVKGLNLGAAEYITKPFYINELLIRAKRIIDKNKGSLIKVKDITFDMSKMIVLRDGSQIDLSSLELKIIHLLFLNIGKVVSRNIILDKIWEWTGNDVDDHTVTVYLKRIREKIQTDIIVTIKGIGYRIDEE